MEVVGNVNRKIWIAIAVEIGSDKWLANDVSRWTNKVIADDVCFPIGGRCGVAHDEADVPVKGDVVRPFE